MRGATRGGVKNVEMRFVDGDWRLSLETGTYRLTPKMADLFVSTYMGETALVGLVSPVLVWQIMCWSQGDQGETRMLGRAIARPMMDVVAAVTAPEPKHAPERTSWEKEHTRFGGPALGPLDLWHKHISLPCHMPANAAATIPPRKSDDFKAVADRLLATAESTHAATDGDSDAVAEAMAATFMQPVDQRIADRKQTGDWIVFEVVGGRPYFLCLSQHPDKGERQSDEGLARLVQLVRRTWSRPGTARG